jgi:two-component system OmpR family response regulator
MYQFLSNGRIDTNCDIFLMSLAYPVHIFEDMTKSAHILIVDDHQEIRHLVSRILEKDGYRVSTAADGRQMRQRLRDHNIDLIVLDLMLPVEDGLALCRDLRAKSSPIPIIILTAKGDEIDRVLGLEMGADDYVAKPFSSRELLARIKAVLRRSHAFPPQGRNADPALYRFGHWSLDTTRRELENDDIVVPLSTGEFNLLMAFLRHPHRVLNRDQLLDLAKGRSAAPLDRSIDLQVSRLRRKIEKDAKNPEIIKTIWGDGYIFTPEVENE